VKEKFTKQPEDATHYMEAYGDWVGTWFKKDENGKWLGKTDCMSDWCSNCGYEEDLIKPIPVNHMHKAAPKMYAMLEAIYVTGMQPTESKLKKLLAEARGEL
jgi:hypothetical protein